VQFFLKLFQATEALIQSSLHLEKLLVAVVFKMQQRFRFFRGLNRSIKIIDEPVQTAQGFQCRQFFFRIRGLLLQF